MGEYPPSFRAFLESQSVRPLLTHHKKGLSPPVDSNPNDLHAIFLGMVWPFTVEWCLLCARELVRAVIRTPCCRVLVHKACLYAALAISPSRPTPTYPHCQQELGLASFRRLYWRLSGKWSPWFECPLAPVSPSRSFLPWGLLTEHGSATTVFRWSSRRPRRTGKWNPSVDLLPRPLATLAFPRPLASLAHVFLCSFHLGATTTTTTIVTTPRRQATAGNYGFLFTHGGNRLGP